MSKSGKTREAATDGPIGGNGSAADETFRVDDRRHWAIDETETAADEPAADRGPTIVDEYRERAEAAERKLQDYIEAFKGFRDEQEELRERLSRDVERRVRLMFGEVVAGLLASVDDLELALAHAREVPEARALADGVAMARDRFLAALERSGVERITPDGAPFDPNEAEALHLQPVDSPERDGMVTATLRPGYRYGEHVIRAAQVAVGRFESAEQAES